jgi:uncharacterized protein YndB with AHSA1/START domain
MSSKPFVIERTYNAPIARVWKAISDKQALAEWYFNLSDFKAEPGFEFTFPGQDKGKTFIHHCRVLEVIPEKKLSYTWAYAEYEGNSVVTFELFEEGDKTRIRLTHTGLETFPKLPSFSRENFTMGWTEIIGNMLKTYVEK